MMLAGVPPPRRTPAPPAGDRRERHIRQVRRVPGSQFSGDVAAIADRLIVASLAVAPSLRGSRRGEAALANRSPSAWKGRYSRSATGTDTDACHWNRRSGDQEVKSLWELETKEPPELLPSCSAVFRESRQLESAALLGHSCGGGSRVGIRASAPDTRVSPDPDESRARLSSDVDVAKGVCAETRSSRKQNKRRYASAGVMFQRPFSSCSSLTGC